MAPGEPVVLPLTPEEAEGVSIEEPLTEDDEEADAQLVPLDERCGLPDADGHAEGLLVAGGEALTRVEAVSARAKEGVPEKESARDPVAPAARLAVSCELLLPLGESAAEAAVPPALAEGGGLSEAVAPRD